MELFNTFYKTITPLYYQSMENKLWYTITHCGYDKVKELLDIIKNNDEIIDLNCKNNRGKTMFMLACSKIHLVDIITSFIDIADKFGHIYDLNMTDNNGNTIINLILLNYMAYMADDYYHYYIPPISENISCLNAIRILVGYALRTNQTIIIDNKVIIESMTCSNILKLFLEYARRTNQYINLNEINHKRTPLIEACRNSVDAVEILLDYSIDTNQIIDVNKRTNNSATALAVVCIHENMDISESDKINMLFMLIQYAEETGQVIDINRDFRYAIIFVKDFEPSSYHNGSPFICALHHNYYNIITILINYAKESYQIINLKDIHRYIKLYSVKPDLLEILLDYSLEINQIIYLGLENLYAYKKIRSIEMLMRYSEQTDQIIDISTIENFDTICDPDIFILFLNYAKKTKQIINPNTIYNNKTILMMACSKNNYEMVKILLTLDGIDINMTNKDGLKAYDLTDNDDIKKMLKCYIGSKTKSIY